mgnify:FL=1
MAQATLLDIAKLNGNDQVIGLIEENISSAPELSIFPSRTIKGTTYTTGVRTGLPTVGFRDANAGVAPSKSTFKKNLVECFILSSLIRADKAVADAYEDGADAWKMIEASGVMRAAMQRIGKQTWYGTSSDAKGFAGFKAFLAAGGKTLAGDELTIDASGSTANTASSVYAVKFGEQDAQFVFGQNSIMELGEWRNETVTDSEGKGYEAYAAALTAWVGLQIGNENCARRIYNLTVANGLTDALLAKLIATFPVGVRPDAIFGSRRSIAQLQASRTVALYGTGTNRPNQPNVAPYPTEFEGIKIIATDSILNTDAIES